MNRLSLHIILWFWGVFFESVDGLNMCCWQWLHINTFDWRETHKDTVTHCVCVCVCQKTHVWHFFTLPYSQPYKQLYQSLQATAFHKNQAKPSVTGSVTESDILICKKAQSISAMSNHITALQLKCVRCLFWLPSGIWGSIPASRINSGQERLLCIYICVCMCASACVTMCVYLHAKTVPATRLILASEWITFSLLFHPSNTPSGSQSERDTEGERGIIKRDHKTNINGW